MKARAKYMANAKQKKFVSNPLEEEIAQGYNDFAPMEQCQQMLAPPMIKPKPRAAGKGAQSSPGTYDKQEIWLGHVTVRQGERVAIWDSNGKMEVMDGPARPLLLFKTVEKLRRYNADSQHYLIVRFEDGKKEHIPGPVSMFFDPLHHKSITVSHSINLNNDEAMVVYRQLLEGDKSTIEREVIKGPALYTPSSSEWVQEFMWGQGEDVSSVQEGQSTLKLVPEQMFIDVENVRTTDDALLTLNFMIVFQLKDIEKMLAETHDPISDFTTAICSDVITFSSKLTFEAFKSFTDDLSKLSTYSNLMARAETDGFRIVNVVFRGYQPTAALKALQERNVEVRTKLQLESETEEQKEKLLSFKQHAQFERDRERHEMEMKEREHLLSLEQKSNEEKLRQERLKFESELSASRENLEMQAEFEKQQVARELEYLEILHSKFQVDITQYLVAQSESGAPQKVIRLKTDPPGASSAVHLHTSS